MRRLLATCLFCCLALLSTEAAWSGEPARLFLLKAIKAAGGEANLKKLQAQTWNEKGTYYGMGEGLPYTSKLALQFPSQFRMEVSSGGMEVLTIVLDNDKGWIKTPAESRAMTKEELQNERSNLQAGWMASLLPLKDKAYKLEMIPGVEVDKKATTGLKVTRADYPEVKLYFDKQSSLLVMHQYKTFSPEQKKTVLAEVFHQNYMLNDGIQMPTHIVIKNDGKPFLDTDIIDAKAEGKLDAKVFAAPK